MSSPMHQKALVRRDIIDELQRMLVENLYLQIPPETIDPDTTLFGSGLGLDSVDAVELIVSIESRFQINFSKQPQATEVSQAGFDTLSDAIKSDEATEEGAKKVEQNLRIYLRNLNALTDLILYTKRVQTGA